METVWDITLAKQMTSNDQKYFSEAFNKLKKDSSFQHKVLPEHEFSNGNEYFSQRHIMFATDALYPPEVYLVHDNWIVSQAAKVYRFKENLMWMNDRNGYYSNRDAKYLEYVHHEDDPKDSSLEQEQDLFKAALILGSVLNRIVIMPSFTCQNCDTKKFGACLVKSGRCSFQTHFKVEELDKHFKDLYREHMFLMHPMVPETVKKSHSKPIILNVKEKESKIIVTQDKGTISQIDLPGMANITSHDIQRLFAGYSDVSVLVLDLLPDILSRFSTKDKMFSELLSKTMKAFKGSTYVQR